MLNMCNGMNTVFATFRYSRCQGPVLTMGVRTRVQNSRTGGGTQDVPGGLAPGTFEDRWGSV